MIILGVVVLWFACGFLSYGLTLAYFQREYPAIAKQSYKQDCKRAVTILFLGPFGLMSCLLVIGKKHGLLYKNENV